MDDYRDFVSGFCSYIGKNLKWNSVWKRIKRAGFCMEQSGHKHKSHMRHFVCITDSRDDVVKSISSRTSTRRRQKRERDSPDRDYIPSRPSGYGTRSQKRRGRSGSSSSRRRGGSDDDDDDNGLQDMILDEDGEFMIQDKPMKKKNSTKGDKGLKLLALFAAKEEERPSFTSPERLAAECMFGLAKPQDPEMAGERMSFAKPPAKTEDGENNAQNTLEAPKVQLPDVAVINSSNSSVPQSPSQLIQYKGCMYEVKPVWKLVKSDETQSSGENEAVYLPNPERAVRDPERTMSFPPSSSSSSAAAAALEEGAKKPQRMLFPQVISELTAVEAPSL